MTFVYVAVWVMVALFLVLIGLGVPDFIDWVRQLKKK